MNMIEGVAEDADGLILKAGDSIFSLKLSESDRAKIMGIAQKI